MEQSRRIKPRHFFPVSSFFWLSYFTKAQALSLHVLKQFFKMFPLHPLLLTSHPTHSAVYLWVLEAPPPSTPASAEGRLGQACAGVGD